MINTYEYHPFTKKKLTPSFEIELPDVNLNDRVLSIFTIGPVQSFISSAKKAMDMWAGSYLLSYLTWQAIELVINRESEDSIIFPLVKEQPFYKRFVEKNDNVDNLSMPSIPNRFIAVLDKKEAVNLMENCEIEVKNKLIDILGATNITASLSRQKIAKVREQLDKFLEIYWIVLPIETSIEKVKQQYLKIKNVKETDKLTDSSYAIMVKLAEELLGSRKVLRNFDYIEEKGRKCFICGQYKSIIPVKNEDQDVCGICALKRNLTDYYAENISPQNIKPYYQSVVEIAAMDYKEELISRLRNRTEELKEIIKLLDKNILGGVDLGLLYPELKSTVLFAVTEKRTREEIDTLVRELEGWK